MSLHPHLPGRCMGCGASVVWNLKSWQNPGKYGRRHVCPVDRPSCGAWMRNARDRCARRPGHTTEHRTAFAMANQYRAAMGRERVA